MIPEGIGKWILSPRQRDGPSCGVMVIAQVCSHLGNLFAFQQRNVDDMYVRIMRLRILWVIVCRCEVQHPDRDNTLHADLAKYFKADDVTPTGAFILYMIYLFVTISHIR